MPWYRQLYWQIIIGMIAGLIFGLLASSMGWIEFTSNWIKPWGTIFINLLKLIAIPMILASLVTGVASLSDLAKLSRIGGKTIALYVGTTIIAIIVGLIIVNMVQPGKSMSLSMREKMAKLYSEKVEQSAKTATETRQSGPLQPIIDIVPGNVFQSISDNKNMLQVVFLAIMLGIGLIQVEKSKSEHVRVFFQSLNDVILNIVELVMKFAPIGVFAQISSVLTELSGSDPRKALEILQALGAYGMVVLLGLLIHTGGFYSLLLRLFTPMSVGFFFKTIRPAQIIAFSTSSSAATLPVNMERCEKGLGIPEEITSFTLPLGATINMDGTAVYQSVAAVFIAQVLGMNLTFLDQVTIVLTATLASIGAAGVPGAGVVMLVIVLQSIHVPIEGIALILGIDRILDMFRTVTNITGDAVITSIVAHSERCLPIPVKDSTRG